MRNFSWNFDVCGPACRGSGTINPSSKHFKNQTKIQALVREALQNSLDAAIVRYDSTHPVKVNFQFKTIENVDDVLPNFTSELYRHIKGCNEMYPGEKSYQNMLLYLEQHKASLPVLYISDENTKGMFYEKDNPNCTFYGYLKADGAHVDQGHGDGGGSNGIGKMASFNYSKLATVLVSSYSKLKEQKIFQGATILCSHYADNSYGERKLYYGGGFYDCNGGEAVTDECDIHKDLLRYRHGTDIIIVGVDDEDMNIQNSYAEIERNVMLNFWPAIDNGTLIVQVGDTVIDADKLEKRLQETFRETIDTDTHYVNPLPYYLAVKGAQRGDEDCRMYGDNDEELGIKKHPTLGQVHLYIKKNKGSKDRIIATRKPRMVIQPFNRRSAYGYSAVVFCDDENGNIYLSNAEGPAHNKWDATGLEGEEGSNSRKAIEELDNYIKECVLNFFASDISDECNIEGLSELLSSYGQKSSKSGMMTTSIKSLLKEKNKVKSTPIDHVVEEEGEIVEDEEESNMFGGDNSDGGENDPDYLKREDNNEDRGDQDNDNNTDVRDDDNELDENSNATTDADKHSIEGAVCNIKEQINCDPIPMSIKRDGRVICRLKLNMPKTVENGLVVVYVATADGKLQRSGKDTANVQRLEWAEVNGESAVVDKNQIVNVSLLQGDNVIDFRFPTNNRYRLIIEIYSLKK